MPEAFNRCVKGGGRVRTIRLGTGGKYKHICFKGGKSYAGETHMRKSGSAASYPRQSHAASVSIWKGKKR